MLPTLIVLAVIAIFQFDALKRRAARISKLEEEQAKRQATVPPLSNLNHFDLEVTAIHSDSEGNEVRTSIEFFESAGKPIPQISRRHLCQLDERNRPIRTFSLEDGEKKLYSEFHYEVEDSEIPTQEVYFNELGGREVVVLTHISKGMFSVSVRSRILSDLVEVIYTKLDQKGKAAESRSAVAEWPRTMAQRHSKNFQDGWPYTLLELAERFDELFPKATPELGYSHYYKTFGIPDSDKSAISFELSRTSACGELIIDLRHDLQPILLGLPDNSQSAGSDAD